MKILIIKMKGGSYEKNLNFVNDKLTQLTLG